MHNSKPVAIALKGAALVIGIQIILENAKLDFQSWWNSGMHSLTSRRAQKAYTRHEKLKDKAQKHLYKMYPSCARLNDLENAKDDVRDFLVYGVFSDTIVEYYYNTHKEHTA